MPRTLCRAHARSHRGSPTIAPDGSFARLLGRTARCGYRARWRWARWSGATRRAERFFGHTLEEYAGRSGLEFVHPDDLELVLRSLASIQSKEVGTTLEVRLRSTSGWRLIELIGTPVGWFAPAPSSSACVI